GGRRSWLWASGAHQEVERRGVRGSKSSARGSQRGGAASLLSRRRRKGVL
ncbi:hypothetical protein T484DRAFT_1960630, partial [Baffinella frigidus]